MGHGGERTSDDFCWHSCSCPAKSFISILKVFRRNGNDPEMNYTFVPVDKQQNTNIQIIHSNGLSQKCRNIEHKWDPRNRNVYIHFKNYWKWWNMISSGREIVGWFDAVPERSIRQRMPSPATALVIWYKSLLHMQNYYWTFFLYYLLYYSLGHHFSLYYRSRHFLSPSSLQAHPNRNIYICINVYKYCLL